MRLAAGLVALLTGLSAALGAAGTIDPFVRGTFAQIRNEHAARPLVVHFWSLTCPPCLAEMPRLAAFAKSRGDFDLVLVTTDPIEQRARVGARLEQWGLSGVPNFAYADTFEERLRFEVDPDWHGELPFTTLTRPDGNTTTIAGAIEPAQLRAWLDGAEAGR